MSPEAGEQLMLWTVRASVACYVIALWRWLFRPANGTTDRTYSLCWTASWLLCVIHMVCAFHFRHHWDHAVALEHTAKTTEDVVGLRWGGGLYINYVFLACWGISAIASLISTAPPTVLRRRLDATMHLVAAFMMFNATAVFGPPWWWIPALLVTGLIVYRWRRAGIHPQPPAAA